MALETMNGVMSIRGFSVLQDRPRRPDGTVDWDLFDEQRKANPIYVDHDLNMISFRIQNGPIKENGVNGCQVDTLIHAARHIIEQLNEKFPCDENYDAINCLTMAILHLEKRTKKRETRGVEGTSQL